MHAQLAQWEFADAIFSTPFDFFNVTTKLRKAGFEGLVRPFPSLLTSHLLSCRHCSRLAYMSVIASGPAVVVMHQGRKLLHDKVHMHSSGEAFVACRCAR